MSKQITLRAYPIALLAGALGLPFAGPIHGQELPQRGRIVYEGTYSGKQTEGFVLFNQGPKLEGAIRITIDFDGKSARATYKTTGKLASGSASGLVEGDVCKLFGPKNLTIEADCTSDTFSGRLFQQPRPELRREVTFELTRRLDSVSSTNGTTIHAEAASNVISTPMTAPPSSEPATQGEPLPRIASVTYQGTYSGLEATSSRSGVKQAEMSGAFTATIQFDGPSVVADFKTTGTLRSFKVTGSRDGTLCKLFASRVGSLVGTCNAEEIDAILRSASDARKQLDVRFKATTIKLTDIEKQREEAAAQRAKLEKERAEARARLEAEQAAAAEVRKREEDAERARLERLLQNLSQEKK